MSITFVLTPGRCGTQWLAEKLGNTHNRNWVCHEPLHFAYDPIRNSPAQPLNQNRERLLIHLEAIRQHVRRGGHYMECGFPCWRHLDWFRQEFGDAVKVLYIHRDPIDNARSLLKLNALVPPILPHLPEKQLFHPGTEGALLPDYGRRWTQLSPFEKCLYYWAEVNLQAAQYQKVFARRNWLTIGFAGLFEEAALTQIAAFAGLEFTFREDMLSRVDQFQGLPQERVDPGILDQHSPITALARELGYPY